MDLTQARLGNDELEAGALVDQEIIRRASTSSGSPSTRARLPDWLEWLAVPNPPP
jgi:hypothetical protein